MSRWNAYLNSGKKIVESYDGRIPLTAWLKDFYRQHKQMGSTDRKIISHLVYSYFRVGHSLPGLQPEERLAAALFLCNSSSSELLAFIKPSWNENIHLSLAGKAVLLQQENISWLPGAIFPWKEELSSDIDTDLFNESHLQQPDLFIRIRPLQEELVLQKLKKAGISFSRPDNNCIALPNATKVDQVLSIDEEVVVQDFNSQRVGTFFQFSKDRPVTWDCCAGSGGKSLLAYDLEPAIHLTVSDARASILQNLQRRFKRAGLIKYTSFVSDLSLPKSNVPSNRFDTIIADVPCSGSGTWARTPEQLFFFEAKRISYYSDLQKKIVSNVIAGLKTSGRLVYITCSVFREENEGMVDFIVKNYGCRLQVMEMLKGYEMKADSMFVAVLEKG